MHTPSQLAVLLTIIMTSSLFAGCTETMPVKEANATNTKSVQDVAKEAMNSTGKLSREQVDALIRANAACRPGDKH